MIRLSVIVVNLNQLLLTKKCVSDLLSQTNKDFDIHLFDQNSSEVGTTEFLNECRVNGINVYQNTENIPLNHIWNNFKSISESEYLCFLNNDTELSNRFVGDTIMVFENEPNVGTVIHTTNNPQYTETKDTLSYLILNPPFYQGWDFSIRRSILPLIPTDLSIFGGDDYIFAKIVHMGYKIAMVFSSPIIHHSRKTRATISNIDTIQQIDSANFYRHLANEGLSQINITIAAGLSYRTPATGMKIT